MSADHQEKPAGGEQKAASWPFSGFGRCAASRARAIVAQRASNAVLLAVVFGLMVAVPVFLPRAMASTPPSTASRGSAALRIEAREALAELVAARDAERAAHIAALVAAERHRAAYDAWKASNSPPAPSRPAAVELPSLLPRPQSLPGADPSIIWPQEQAGSLLERLILSFDPPPAGPSYPPLRAPLDIAAAHAIRWGEFIDRTEPVGGLLGVSCTMAGPHVARCRAIFHRGIQAARCSTSVLSYGCTFLMLDQ